MNSPLKHTADLQLPPLGRAQQQRSQTLVRHIVDEIEVAGGVIDFSRYMDLALHAPELGYYACGQQKFGEAGDFVTAPELGDLFACCLGRQISEVFERLAGGSVLEAGAGSGQLATDLLKELEISESLPEYYFILETSADLRALQRQTLETRVPHLCDRVRWLDAWPAQMRGVVMGNEVLDAMPVRRFRVTQDAIRWIGVGWNGSALVEREHTIVDAESMRYLQAFDLQPGYTSELQYHAQAWVRSVADILGAGVVLLMDYGFPAHEFYHRDRARGTLMCHYRHRAHSNPYINVGCQDITAHIDFSRIARAATEGGLEVIGYTQQAPFLLSLGLTEILQRRLPPALPEQMALTQQVKKLTLPSEMGELFKVIALGRDVEPSLSGFALSNVRDRL